MRITPSGWKRYFIHRQHRGHRVWKSVGDAAVMTETDACARARSMLAVSTAEQKMYRRGGVKMYHERGSSLSP